MRPEGPKNETEGRERGEVLGRGQQAPSARRSGERSELPSGIQGGALTAERVFTIFSTQDGLS